MHVLLLTYHYPPDHAVGGLRPAKVAAALAAAGHRVTVVTARLRDEPAAGRQAPPGVTIRPVRPLRNPRELYLALKRWASSRRAEGARTTAETPAVSAGEAEEAPSAHAPLWKRTISSLLWLPDDRQGFIPAAVREARRVMAETAVDAIYTSAPPFSVHLAGLVLHRWTGVRWISEYRDPWVGNPSKSAEVQTAFSRRVERALERRCLRAADPIIAVSDGIRRVLVERLPPAHRSRVVLVRNGIDRLRSAPMAGGVVTPREGPFRIVHTGTLYLNRNPRAFLEGVARLREELRLTPAQLRIELIGKAKRFGELSVEQEVRRLGIADLVDFTDWVPQAEARRATESADLLLLFAQGQPLQVPNKLYDYLGTRVPVLGFVDAAGESAALLREVGGHFLVTSDDPAEVAAALRSAFLADAAGTMDSQGNAAEADRALERWTTSAQMRELVHVVESAGDARAPRRVQSTSARYAAM